LTPYDQHDLRRRNELEALPLAGQALAKAHDATAALRPHDDDDEALRVAKRVTQGAIITAAAGLVAIAIL